MLYIISLSTKNPYKGMGADALTHFKPVFPFTLKLQILQDLS